VLKAPSLTTPANRPGAKDPRIQGSQDAAIVRTRKSTAVAKKNVATTMAGIRKNQGKQSTDMVVVKIKVRNASYTGKTNW